MSGSLVTSQTTTLCACEVALTPLPQMYFLHPTCLSFLLSSQPSSRGLLSLLLSSRPFSLHICIQARHFSAHLCVSVYSVSIFAHVGSTSERMVIRLSHQTPVSFYLTSHMLFVELLLFKLTVYHKGWPVRTPHLNVHQEIYLVDSAHPHWVPQYNNFFII